MMAGDWPGDARFYQDIWEGVEGALLLLDPGSKILAANAEASRLSQYSRSELHNASMGLLITEPDLLMARQMRQALRRGERYVADVPWRRKDGSTVLVEMTGTPVDLYGQPMALLLCREAALAKESEAALRSQLSQLESLYLASSLMITDRDLPHLLDRIAEHVSHLTDATMVGLYIYDVEADVLVLQAAHGVPASAIGKVFVRDEGVSWRAFASRRLVNTARYSDSEHAINLAAKFSLDTDRYQHIPLLALPLIWQDQVLGVLTLAEPTGGRPFGAVDEYVGGLLANQVSMAIKQAMLYSELRASSQELVRANVELRELDRMKDDFLSMVSHELRQPLATARLGIDLLLRQRDCLNEQQATLLASALRGIDAQSKLIGDLLYLVDLTPPDDAFADAVDLGEVVRAVSGAMAQQAEAKGLVVEVHLCVEPVMCKVTVSGLERVVQHLLSNAIKFTPRGRIQIEVRRDDLAGEAVLEVKDSGIGITSDQQRRIFDRFYQVEGSTGRSYEGLGLGLALVRRITEMYKGRVGVQSNPGGGSIFSVVFPLAS